jgi:DNA-binding transcriptional MerR regulator
MNIRDAATQSGLSIDTIRFYEKAGMLPTVPRDGRGWRRFDGGLVEWLRNLERLRATGMPLREVRAFAVLVHTADANAAGAAEARLVILRRHAERLEQRRQDIAACQAYLTHKIAVYSGKGTT